MKLIKWSYKFIKRYDISIYFPLPIMLLGFFTHLILKPPDLLTDLQSINILIPYDSFKFSTDEIKNHNLALINMFQQRLSMEKSSLSSAENIRWQARTVWLGIFAIIMTLAFKQQSNKKFQYIILLIIITLMYLLDVHLEDLYNRQNIRPQIIGRTIEELVDFKYKKRINSTTNKEKNNCSLNDSTWYDYNSIALAFKLNDASKSCARFNRKLHLAYKWDLVRLTYYIVPWLILYILLIFDAHKKKSG